MFWVVGSPVVTHGRNYKTPPHSYETGNFAETRLYKLRRTLLLHVLRVLFIKGIGLRAMLTSYRGMVSHCSIVVYVYTSK